MNSTHLSEKQTGVRFGGVGFFTYFDINKNDALYIFYSVFLPLSQFFSARILCADVPQVYRILC